ncbi:MAG: response regulator [Actinobacteria bacterium]|nr:response regulator [Actinomycetota bacterium]
MTSVRRPRVRVVVVEDSTVQRAHLVHTLQADGDIEVIGEAADAPDAVARVAELRPDVVTVDLQIPGGGGQHVIEQVMAHTPTPILVLSAKVAGPQSAPAIDALVAGALDAAPKPARWTAVEEGDLRRRVRALNGVTVLRHPRGRLVNARAEARGFCRTGEPVVAIAASTGGPPALATVLSGLARVGAPVLVVQHIHDDFVDGLVSWMARVAPLPVRMAAAGDRLHPGTVYIGPGGCHLRVDRDLRVVLDPEPVTTHRPSADELFRSIAQHVGRSAVGVVLTGMGDDGAAGLLAIRNAGGRTLAQDQATSAVFGMPRAAYLAGAVEQQVAIDDMADAIVRAAARFAP